MAISLYMDVHIPQSITIQLRRNACFFELPLDNQDSRYEAFLLGCATFSYLF